jgi:multiple sugar transport system ATP-binding protein
MEIFHYVSKPSKRNYNVARVLLQQVSKVYDGDIEAVNNMTLDVADGEFMVIVGPSGCGKTTTLRMIAGFEELTGGTIMIGSCVVNEVSPGDRDVAMVFQNHALYPHMTIFENLAFALSLKKLPKQEIRKRVEQTAEILDIHKLLHRKPKSISGGQRQRVALGRAIIRKPAAFLFDEPLSNLDAKLRSATATELKSIHQKIKTTTIYVTHDQGQAMMLGDRICVMHDGRIQQTGRPIEVYQNPANRFVAGFLGTPPMNFIDGTIRRQGDLLSFEFEDVSIILPDRLQLPACKYVDQTMTMAIRPEDLCCDSAEPNSDLSIPVIVQVVENLGDKQHIFLKTPKGQEFAATVNPHVQTKVNDRIQMSINPRRVMIFQPGPAGKNIQQY